MDVPWSRSDRLEPELFGDLGGGHGVWQILLVGKDEQDSVSQFVLVQHALQFFPGLGDSVSVVGVDHEDDTLGVLEVVSPQRSDLVLSTDIPHGERDVLVFNGFDVETNGWDCGNDLTELQLVKDGGLTGGIKPHHEDSHLLVTEKALQQLGN